ncbi:hypothetical protein NQ314_006112 [Rhamnusium bicolor]|uniref:DDE-1 domain-containing protein n=1 Tax=Rhamnusium bicolor TaxID=1586634 RepID=A0AAV8Z7M1_9CUCU|nr:hypothetical protein NQ314_006112 [Rhamnusium bicolor]
MKKKGRCTMEEMSVVVEDVELLASKWFDNKQVYLLNSFVGAYPTSQVKRWDSKTKSKIDIECPKSFKTAIADTLCAKGDDYNHQKRRGRPSSSGVQQEIDQKAKKGKPAAMPTFDTRRDSTGHWPEFQEKRGRKMPRTYRNKTDKISESPEEINVAVNRVLKDGLKIRRVAHEFRYSFASLLRHVEKAKALAEDEQSKYNFVANPNSRLWNKREAAEKDWLAGFIERNSDLSVRQPEATSLSRSTAKHNINIFFQKLSDLRERYNFPSSNIYNCDETGCTTVHKPPKVLAKKVQKQVEHMVIGGPDDCLGLAYLTGWMTKENFVKVLHHFIKHSGVSKENPCLLLLDNHQSHVNLDVINHRLQPLDVGVYGPFKAYYKSAAAAWLPSNPGKTISWYQIPELVKSAINNAITRNNILSAFEKSGIHPFNPDVFSEHDFLTSHVTDRVKQDSPASECSRAHSEQLGETQNLLHVQPEQKTPPQSSDDIVDLQDKDSPVKKVEKKSSECDSTDTEEAIVNDSSDSEFYAEDSREPDYDHAASSAAIGDFVVVRFLSNDKKPTEFHYVGQIDKILESGEYLINFLRRRSGGGFYFSFPDDKMKPKLKLGM